MATPNYGFEKRQKELAKKRKKEEKLKHKAERKHSGLPDDPQQPDADDQEPGAAAGDAGAGAGQPAPQS